MKRLQRGERNEGSGDGLAAGDEPGRRLQGLGRRVSLVELESRLPLRGPGAERRGARAHHAGDVRHLRIVEAEHERLQLRELPECLRDGLAGVRGEARLGGSWLQASTMWGGASDSLPAP